MGNAEPISQPAALHLPMRGRCCSAKCRCTMLRSRKSLMRGPRWWRRPVCIHSLWGLHAASASHNIPQPWLVSLGPLGKNGTTIFTELRLLLHIVISSANVLRVEVSYRCRRIVCWCRCGVWRCAAWAEIAGLVYLRALSSGRDMCASTPLRFDRRVLLCRSMSREVEQESTRMGDSEYDSSKCAGLHELALYRAPSVSRALQRGCDGSTSGISCKDGGLCATKDASPRACIVWSHLRLSTGHLRYPSLLGVCDFGAFGVHESSGPRLASAGV